MAETILNPSLTVSISTAAKMLEVSSQTIARLIKSKKLRASKPDRRVMIRIADIEAMLDANPWPGGRGAVILRTLA
jgi:excisionase family DNA binding protein